MVFLCMSYEVIQLTEIKDMRVNWHVGLGNYPSLELLVDKIPDYEKEMIPYLVKRVDKTLFLWKNMGGLVTFMVRSTDLSQDTNGFGRHHFNILTTEGKMEFYGAWSSRYSIMNQYFEPPVLNVAITDNKYGFQSRFVFMAYNYILDDLIKAMKRFLPFIELSYLDVENNEVVLKSVKKAGLHKKIWDKEYTVFPRISGRAYCEYCKSLDKDEYKQIVEKQHRRSKIGIISDKQQFYENFINKCPKCRSEYHKFSANKYLSW